MAGDGINEDPALMEANVRIATGSGTGSANVLLLGNGLLKVVEVIRVCPPVPPHHYDKLRR